MKSRARYVLIVLLGLSLGACRQADGPMPTPTDEIEGELVDMTNDLRNVALGRDPQGPEDLAHDLRKYAEDPAALSAADELSRRTSAVLAGVDLTEETAQKLAHSLWLSVAANQLSERQIQTLQNDVHGLLTAEGVDEEDAQQVAAQVGDLQGVVTGRVRRWYELF